jgi:hypothetical protein
MGALEQILRMLITLATLWIADFESRCHEWIEKAS